MKEKVEAEIIALHQFFQDWFNAELPNTDDAFARFTDAMDSDFRMIVPDGSLVERAALLIGLRNAHGKQPGIRIWIENTQIHWNQNALWLATYEEWQEAEGDPQGRISTVLFAEDSTALSGLKWRHVHETFLPS